VKALHIGGPLGGLVPISEINKLTVDYESFQEHGFLLGHASMVSIPASFPLIKYLQHLFEFTAHESCGKCFPCRLGSTRGHEMFTKAIDEGYKIDKNLLNDLLETMEIGSLCALGGGLPLPIKNALQYFQAELSDYLK
jgi:NADH-quinone oxidoreductase subunit F